MVPPGLDVHFARHPFPTQMGRDLVVAELDGLAVGTVHLESANHQSTREEQLTVCAKVGASRFPYLGSCVVLVFCPYSVPHL